MDDKIIKKAIEYIQELFRENAGGHDPEHSLRVYRNALMIAENEPDCDVLVISLAALLHDVDDHKLFDTEDYANARAFLKENRLSPEMIDRICRDIASVSFSRNRGTIPDSLEGMIVQDADRLDALGAVGVARTFAFGGQHGRPMGESLQHFYDKLLKLRDLMNTESGKQLAIKRHAFLEDFLREYQEETDSNR